MSITWTKSFSSGDDGSILTGQQLGDLQSDINSNCVNITDNQTVAGNKTFTGTVTFNNALYYIIQRLSSTDSVNMSVGSTLLYTVPSTKICVITAAVVRNISSTLAGSSDYDFGQTTLASGWIQSVDLSTLTTATVGFRLITPAANVDYVTFTGNASIYIKATAGVTTNATATVDLWGYLV